MSTGHIIRPWQESDVPTLRTLALELGYPCSEEEMRTRLQQMQGSVMVASTPAQQVMGWVHVYALHLPHLPPYAEVSALVVGQTYKRLGLGGILLNAAEDWARANGLSLLRLYSSMARAHEAHPFYLRQGYQAQKQKMLFVKNLVPEPT